MRKAKGITLVSLVVTIILLLILAGVSIRTLGGENGLITKTKIAKEENLKAEYKEKLTIAKTEAIAEKSGQDITLDEYIEQIKADKIEGIKSIEKITNDSANVTTEEGYMFIITVNSIEYYENENNLPEMNIKDANIEFSFNPDTWTNKSVEVTVSKKESKYVIQLSKDAENWTTANKMDFDENGTIFVRLKDPIGRVSDYASRKISIIDKEKPVVTEATSNTNSVRIKATDNAAGITGYAVTTIDIEPTEFTKCDSTKSLDVTVDSLKQGTTYYAWVKDAAGNVSTSKSTDTSKVAELKIQVDNANWSTSKTITITAVNSNYSNIRYTTDGTIPTSTTGTEYTAAFTITSNCTITAVAFDSTGQAGSTATNKVTTIDTEKPVVTSATPSTNSVRIKATDNAAGITGYAVTTSTTVPTSFTGCTSTKSLDVTVENLTQGTAYYAWVKDAAGNVSASKSTGTGTVTELTITANTANWSTSKTITITAADNNYSNIRYTTDGTIPTSTTGTTYTEPFTITSNCTITAVAFDSTGQAGSTATNKVTTIDTEKPVVTSATPSTNSVRIKATDNAAGITGYAVTTSATAPTAFTKCDSTKSLDVTVDGLKQGTTYYAWVKDAAGNVSTSKSTGTNTVTELKIQTDNANWSTSKKITITATNSNYSNIRYTTDGTIPTSTTGTAYTAAFKITKNCTITAIAFDDAGQAGSAATNKVTTIDTTKPVVSSATSSTNSVRIKATDNAAGIVGYAITTSTTAPTAFTKCDSTKSLDVTVGGLKQGTTYYAWVKDAAGNVSAGKSTATGSVTGLEIKVNTANWSTSKTITITATDSNYSNIRYTTDGTIPTSTTGTAYTAAFKVTKNCTVTAVAFDNVGQAGSAATNKVTTIDATKPVVSSATSSTNSVRIKATDNAAGIVGYAITTSTTAPTAFTKCDSTKSLDVTVDGLKQGTTYYAWVKDAAGNVSTGKSTATGSVTGLTISTNTANWSTSKTITITASNSNYSNIRYTTDGTIPTSTTGTEYTAAFKITSNCTITAVAFDSTGQAGSTATNKVTTIDTEKPVVTSATPSTNSVRIKATDNAAGITGYAVTTSTTAPTSFTGCTSTKSLDVTVPNLTQGTAYYAWVKDAAGNVSAGKSTATGTVTELTITTNTANWSTSKTITITATDSNYSNIRYTTDGTIPTSTTGTAYTAAFKVTKNCTITAIAFDDAGQAGSAATNKITRIDTTGPEINTALKGTGATNSITLSVEATDGQSGTNKIIWYYKASDATNYINATDTYTATTSKVTKTHTFTGLEPNKTYNAYAEIYDAVGNKTSTSCNVTTTKYKGALTLSASSGETCIGKKLTFTVTKNASSGSLTVTSSDTNIATVAISGTTITVTPKKAGNVTIIAKSAETNNYYASQITYSAKFNSHTSTTGGSLVSSATCTAKAKYHHKCSVCGINLSTTYESGSALGHDYNTDSGVQYKAATCTTPRYNYKKCGRCGSNPKSSSYVVSTGSALGHNYNTDSGVQYTAATCTTPRYNYKKCGRCGSNPKSSSYIVSTGSALGHNYQAQNLSKWEWLSDRNSGMSGNTALFSAGQYARFKYTSYVQHEMRVAFYTPNDGDSIDLCLGYNYNATTCLRGIRAWGRGSYNVYGNGTHESSGTISVTVNNGYYSYVPWGFGDGNQEYIFTIYSNSNGTMAHPNTCVRYKCSRCSANYIGYNEF